MGNVAMTRTQEITLVVMRTLIGWHFLYEGSAIGCVADFEAIQKRERVAVPKQA